jgi:hypothetical protein
MSFQIGNSKGTIGYNYYRTTIYKNQYQNTIENSRYIKVPYTLRTNEPNITFLDHDYIAKNISIVRKIHVVDGVDYDASLLIEHESTTNKANPLFVCLLLKSGNVRTSIDDIIESKRDTDLVLNEYITSEKAIYYENLFVKKSTVVIFTTPIFVASTFRELRSGGLYIAPYSEMFSTITVEPILGGSIIEGFQEGMDVTQMAGYCTPISETDPTITDAATIMLDANSGLIKNQTTDATLTTAMNFFGFFVLMLFAVFATPPLYKFFLLELVMDNETFDAQQKLNRMNAVDMATTAIMFTFAFAFINYGIASASTIALLIGFYVFIYFLASLFVLQYQRIFNETEYLEQFGKGSYMPSFKNIRNDLGGLLMANVKELYSMNAAPILIVIFLVLYGIYYVTGALKTKGSFYFMSIPFALFFLSWYLTILIKHFWYVYDKNNMAKTPSSVSSTLSTPSANRPTS